MEQIQKTAHREDEELPEVEAKELETHTDIDALLDEIDDVLEENAEEFVAAYIQKGGE